MLSIYVVRAVRVSIASEAKVRPALERYAPQFVLYYAAEHGARYQLGMWLPYLERLGRPFVVITRNTSTVDDIVGLTSAPVLVPRLDSTHATLSRLLVRSMKAAFYVQGHPGNLGLQSTEWLTHVWLNHGDSDKKANFSAQHAAYDKIVVAGQQAVDRYAAHRIKVRPDQFVVVGRPQVERILPRDQPLPADAPRTVLYAPTWLGGRPGTSYSSLHLGPQIVAALLERGATVIFRPHPLSRREPAHAALITAISRTLEADRSAHGRGHVWGARAESERDVADCINASDALITDVSSVASDTWPAASRWPWWRSGNVAGPSSGRSPWPGSRTSSRAISPPCPTRWTGCWEPTRSPTPGSPTGPAASATR